MSSRGQPRNKRDRQQAEKPWKPAYKKGQVVLVKEILFEGSVAGLSRGPWWGTITRIDADGLLYKVMPLKHNFVPLSCTEEQIVDLKGESQ
jgi:hypothetical protein